MIWQNLVVRDNDGRKLDHATLEVLRMRAVEQVGAGAHPEDVAAALGMHRKTVYGWLAKYREGGKELLRARGWQLAARRPWDLPFAEWVPDVHDHLARWALWSRGRGVVSHETALAVHSIGEFESPHVHLTVPPGFTMRNDAVTLHYTRPPRLSQDPRRRRTTGT